MPRIMPQATPIASFRPLAAALVLTGLWPIVRVFAGAPVTELELLVLSYVPGVFVMLWAMGDAQRQRCTPLFDFGLLMWLLFPLSLLGYLMWTRGWRGAVVFAGLMGAI